MLKFILHVQLQLKGSDYVVGYGERLRKLRKAKGLTQQDVADKLKLAKSTISQYESETNEPDAETFSKLAVLYGASIDYIVVGETLSDETASKGAQFLKWINANFDDSFFSDFDNAPEQSKDEMIQTLKFVWEQEKRRRAIKGRKEEEDQRKQEDVHPIEQLAAHFEGEYGFYDENFAKHVYKQIKNAQSEYDAKKDDLDRRRRGKHQG